MQAAGGMYRGGWGAASPAPPAGVLSPRTEKMEAVIQSARSVVERTRDPSVSQAGDDATARQVRAEMDRIRGGRHVLAKGGSAELNELQEELAKIRRSAGVPASDPLADSLLPNPSTAAVKPILSPFSPGAPVGARGSPERAPRATLTPDRHHDAVARTYDGRATTRPPNFGVRHPTLSPRTPLTGLATPSAARAPPVNARYLGGRAAATPLSTASVESHDPLAGLLASRDVSPSPLPPALAHERREAAGSVKSVKFEDQAAEPTQRPPAEDAVPHGIAEASLDARDCEIAALKQQLALNDERYAAELRAWEAKAAAQQQQLQRALGDGGRATPRTTELNLEHRVQEQVQRAEAAEGDLAKTATSLLDADEMIKSLQAKLEAKEVELAGLVSRTRREMRGELERAHVEVVDRQQEAFDESIKSLDEAAQREVARLGEQLAALREEYVGLEMDRDNALRAEATQAEDIRRLSDALSHAQKDADEVELYRGQADRDRAAICDLKLLNTRLQSREGALEARIVELELASGLAQEEAAGEERVKASAELGALQERHRTQGKKDAEELGRLRGLLGAAEARLELLEETNASLEVKVDCLGKELMEVRGEKTTVRSQIDLREMELERSENKMLQIEKNLAEARALLGRQAGQLQAHSERAQGLEEKLAGTELRLDEAERELAGVTAEKFEATATIESQAVDLLRARSAFEMLESEHTSALKRLQEAEIERSQLAGNLDAHRQQLATSEDRSVGLEAALASQAATLRIQLQADVESAYAVRMTRERGEWEESALELRQHLEAACLRRRLQAVKSSAILGQDRAWAFALKYFLQLRVSAAAKKAHRLHQERNRATDEAEAARRRELTLQEEIDMLHCETRRSATELRKHESILPARLALIHRWNEHLLTAYYYRMWTAWAGQRRARHATRCIQTRAVRSLARHSDVAAAASGYLALVQFRQERRVAAGKAAAGAMDEKWRATRGRLSDALEGKTAAARAGAVWSRFATRLLQDSFDKKRSLAADVNCTMESLRFQEETGRRRVARARPLLADMLSTGVLRGVFRRCYSAWVRWMYAKQVRRGVASTAQRDGQLGELKLTLDRLLADHCELTKKYEEASRFEEHNAALADGIARGREEFEHVTRTLSDRIVDLEAAAEDSQLKLRSKEVEMAQWKANETTKHANEKLALEATNKELEANLTDVKGMMLASEEQHAAHDAAVMKYKEENDSLRVNAEALRQELDEVTSKLSAAEEAFANKLLEVPQRQSELERELAATKGNTVELEKQLQGRCSEQIRLANALERSERDRKKAEEDLRMADQALAETKERSHGTIDELNDLTISLQKELQDTQEERARYKKDNASLEVKLAEVTGRIEQVDWTRGKMGSLSDYSKIPEHMINGYTEEITKLKNDLSAKESELAEERIALSTRNLQLEHEMEKVQEGSQQLRARLVEKQNQVNDLNSSNRDLRQRVATLEGDGRPASPPSLAGSPAPSTARTHASLHANKLDWTSGSLATPSPRRGEASPARGHGPTSPPSPFGTRSHRGSSPSGQGAPLTAQELAGLRKIFEYGDTDGDGLLTFEDMVQLSKDTGGELETREQYDELRRDIGAAGECLTFKDLHRLMAGCPRDIEENLRTIERHRNASGRGFEDIRKTESLHVDRSAASFHVSPVAIPTSAESLGDSTLLAASVNALISVKDFDRTGASSSKPSPGPELTEALAQDRARDLLAAPAYLAAPHHFNSHVGSSASTLEITRAQLPGQSALTLRTQPASPRALDSPRAGRPSGTPGAFTARSIRHMLSIGSADSYPGALPFLTANHRAADPIVVVRTYPRESHVPKEQQIPKNALIVEVENLDARPPKTYRIATWEDFLYATSSDAGCHEKTNMCFWYVEGAEAIASWKETYRAEYTNRRGDESAPSKKKKRVFPSFAKTTMKSRTIMMGPLTKEQHKRQVQSVLDDLNVRLADEQVGKLSALILHSEGVKADIEGDVAERVTQFPATGNRLLTDVLVAVETMVGMRGPDDAALKDVEMDPGADFEDVWPYARMLYLDRVVQALADTLAKSQDGFRTRGGTPGTTGVKNDSFNDLAMDRSGRLARTTQVKAPSRMGVRTRQSTAPLQ
eukprot:TRINITY_DN2155_c0_g1_i1.p1 TRINITY_DN2155_c0_g1~~TRINITY_DN2155_c0_g1_i1.p1  ORF type:complete len:2114 (+),score=718.21 TRINITY_DN2155_c0_g1_i1:31-6372(+)